MADLYPQPYTTASPNIISVDWKDIVTGNGFINFFPTLYKDSSFTNLIMNTKALATMASGGLISTTDPLRFQSSKFKQSNEIQGIAYLTAYAVGNITSLTAQLQKRATKDSNEGTSTATSPSEVTHSTTTNTLKKTITVEDYVNKVTFQAKADNSTGIIQHIFYDNMGASWTINTSVVVGAYADKEVSNTNTDRWIKKIEVWLDAGGTGDTVYYKDADVISQDLHITDISPAVSSADVTDETILIPIPLIAKTNIAIGERIILKINKIGAGSLILDPTNTVVSDESLLLSLPFNTP